MLFLEQIAPSRATRAYMLRGCSAGEMASKITEIFYAFGHNSIRLCLLEFCSTKLCSTLLLLQELHITPLKISHMLKINSFSRTQKKNELDISGYTFAGTSPESIATEKEKKNKFEFRLNCKQRLMLSSRHNTFTSVDPTQFCSCKNPINCLLSMNKSSISAAKDNGRNLCQDLFTIENTDSDLEVHALHYANELLVRVRLSFQKLLQTHQTSRNNKKLSKTGLGYEYN